MISANITTGQSLYWMASENYFGGNSLVTAHLILFFIIAFTKISFRCSVWLLFVSGEYIWWKPEIHKKDFLCRNWNFKNYSRNHFESKLNLVPFDKAMNHMNMSWETNNWDIIES